MIQQNWIVIIFEGWNERIGLSRILDIQLNIQIILVKRTSDDRYEYTTHITTFHIYSTCLF